MIVHQGIEEAGDIKNAVVTTGSFDGVHIGHKAIIRRLQKLATYTGGESVLVTFHPHPRKILFPETAGKNLFLINSQREKISLLQETGLDHLLIIRFTPEFSKMSSVDFIRKILVDRLHARKVVVGFNHHFGHNQEGNYEVLYELGRYHHFEVEEIPEQDIENETVSSTRIRKALAEGKIQRANAYLDHFYLIMGTMHKRLAPGQPDGTTAFDIEIEEDCKLIPLEGIYAVSLVQGTRQVKGMAIVKNRMHLGFTQNLGRCVEVYPFDPSINWDGRDVILHFHKMIREISDPRFCTEDMVHFQSDLREVEELIY